MTRKRRSFIKLWLWRNLLLLFYIASPHIRYFSSCSTLFTCPLCDRRVSRLLFLLFNRPPRPPSLSSVVRRFFVFPVGVSFFPFLYRLQTVENPQFCTIKNFFPVTPPSDLLAVRYLRRILKLIIHTGFNCITLVCCSVRALCTNTMAKVSMSPEAIGLGLGLKEHRFSSWSNRMERLLGLGINAKSILSDLPDIKELKEEDVWGDDLQDLTSFSLKEKMESPPDAFRHYTNAKRRAGRERDSGISFALGLAAEAPPSRLSSASRLVPQIAPIDCSRQHMPSQSAPVKVPDWSKIFVEDKMRKDRMEIAEDDDEDEAERLPPHEFVARTQVTSFSVLEGAGRTLKGRDLSRVRNAVWMQTGFHP